MLLSRNGYKLDYILHKDLENFIKMKQRKEKSNKPFINRDRSTTSTSKYSKDLGTSGSFASTNAICKEMSKWLKDNEHAFVKEF